MTINDEELNIVEDNYDGSAETVDTPATADGFEVLPDEAATAPVKKKNSKVELVINIALWVAIAVLVVLVILRLFVFNSVQVKGDSMNSTYEDGEIVVVNKTYSPSRGDVVVFYLNDVDSKFKAMFAPAEQSNIGQPYEKLIKRVVATAGDKIWLRQVSEVGSDIVYEVVIDTVDGDRIYEDYYVKKGETLPKEDYNIHSAYGGGVGELGDCTESKPFVVSKNCIFVMGDNRSNSNDSRSFGEVPLTRLFGVVLDK